MQVLKYRGLNTSLVAKQYNKVVEMIERDDFYSAEIKKISGTKYYRAKLDYTNRLLFTIISCGQRNYALMLEIIYNHAYEKSSFLNNAKIDLNKVEAIVDLPQELPTESLSYINENNPYIHILDRLISLDKLQNETFQLPPPLIIIGSAGSGKTLVALEKMKTYPGQILYVTASAYLVKHACKLYYANNYFNDNQEVDFLSYKEFIETIRVTNRKELDFQIFIGWVKKYYNYSVAHDPNKLYEEFKGVITGDPTSEYLSATEYLNLGIKQSIYSQEERQLVYELFKKYLDYLNTNQLHDANMLAFEYLSLGQAKYNLIVIDEVQDLSEVQLVLLLKSLLYPQQFILCGDSNQIVHPNFFSWAKIKSLFYETYRSTTITQILYRSYRNSKLVVNLANKLLKIKNVRFGSIDQESNYLMESHSSMVGAVYYLANDHEIVTELSIKTAKSTHWAVLVLRDEQKLEASRHFKTPLIFSIHEAKGLEYDNVILYNFIASNAKKFTEIIDGVNKEDLELELQYCRVKNKADRSLEIYKFYVNSLYVAITRAINQVYFVEDTLNHKIFELLDLNANSELTGIEQHESTIDEWQQEVVRLELQGKKAQADAIKVVILHNKPVPWQIITKEALLLLQQQALGQIPNKQSQLLLFEYAFIYEENQLLYELSKVKFAPSINLDRKKSLMLLERKYFIGYAGSNLAIVLQQINLYGINFRNQFNQTPLMVASYFGNVGLVKELSNKGADINLVDNNGHNAWQIALNKALSDRLFAKNKLGSLEPLLNSGELDLQVDAKLVKLGKWHMEFFLVNAMMAVIEPNIYDTMDHSIF